MSVNQRHVELAKSLPPNLLRFFARHPPAALRGGATAATVTPTSETPDDAAQPLRVQPGYETPFEVVKNAETGKFRNPTVSLRRQADLWKLARAHGVEELLPTTIKSAESRQKRREQEGLKVKGTGVGQKVRGHWWERTLLVRQEAKRQAMRNMPEMIREWRKAPRRWKNYPK